MVDPQWADVEVEPDGGGNAASRVQSLERGFSVLKVFSADEPELTLTQVAQRCGLARSAARRFLLTLVDLGYAGVDGRHYYLRSRVLELGFTYLSSLALPEVARPHLAELSARLQRSTSLGILDGDDVVYVQRIAAKRILAVGIGVGTRLPAYLTSHGRVLLAALSDEALDAYLARLVLERRTTRTVRTPAQLRRRIREVRTRGWCMVDQELEEGVSSLAVPLRDVTGDVVASANVAVYSGAGAGTDLLETALEPLQETAAEIEQQLRMAGTSVPRHH
jgi:IclR family transcriptional regulator, pca regulon regulatory protein